MIYHPYGPSVAAESSNTEAYSTWLAIQFFWRPEGLWKSGILLNPESGNPAERYAAELKQKHIQVMKQVIKSHLSKA